MLKQIEFKPRLNLWSWAPADPVEDHASSRQAIYEPGWTQTELVYLTLKNFS